MIFDHRAHLPKDLKRPGCAAPAIFPAGSAQPLSLSARGRVTDAGTLDTGGKSGNRVALGGLRARAGSEARAEEHRIRYCTKKTGD